MEVVRLEPRLHSCGLRGADELRSSSAGKRMLAAFILSSAIDPSASTSLFAKSAVRFSELAPTLACVVLWLQAWLGAATPAPRGIARSF